MKDDRLSTIVLFGKRPRANEKQLLSHNGMGKDREKKRFKENLIS